MDRRAAVAVLAVVACGPAVGTSGEAMGESSGSSGSSSSTSSTSWIGPTEGTGDGTTVADATSTAAVQEIVELEGLLRYDPDDYKSPISFQLCDGSWARLDTWSEAGLAVGSGCAGMYLRVRGSFQPSDSIYGGEELVVTEVLQWRTCEPGDCGERVCEPVTCLWECNPLDQDCASSEKCVPFSNDGGLLDGTRCVPVPDDPDALGEACSRGGVALAVDTCDADAVCLGGSDEVEGICVEMCAGPETMPTCGAGVCAYGPTGGPYCLPECEPELPGCDGVCSPVDGVTVCIPEPGLPELYAPCGPKGCEGDFVCVLEGPATGLCVPPP